MKTFLLSVILCVSCMPLWAQAKTFSADDMQGQWKLIKYTTKEATLDVVNGTATLDESIEQKYGHEYAKDTKAKMEALTEKLRLSYLEIDGKRFSLLLNDVVRSGSFKIKKNKKNKQMVTATFTDTSFSTVPLIIEDGHLVLLDSENNRYTYGKL